MTTKAQFLERVASALREYPTVRTELPTDAVPRNSAVGAELVSLFRDRLIAAGARFSTVPNVAAARANVLELLHLLQAKRVVLGDGDLMAQMAFERETKFDWQSFSGTPSEGTKQRVFQADAGITGCEWLLAESGSVVITTRPGQPRSCSLLPPVHIVVAHTHQLLGSIVDLMDQLGPPRAELLPACISVITGPSKTGDIELRLVTGVHGPGEVHVILIERNQN